MIPGVEPMKSVCAWCGAFLGGDPQGTVISHGICAACAATAIRGRSLVFPADTCPNGRCRGAAHSDVDGSFVRCALDERHPGPCHATRPV